MSATALCAVQLPTSVRVGSIVLRTSTLNAVLPFKVEAQPSLVCHDMCSLRGCKRGCFGSCHASGHDSGGCRDGGRSSCSSGGRNSGVVGSGPGSSCRISSIGGYEQHECNSAASGRAGSSCCSHSRGVCEYDLSQHLICSGTCSS